jgi:hypothetical protein
MANASLPSPMKLRLRSHKSSTSAASDDSTSTVLPRKKIVKRKASNPRGANKRRRDVEDEQASEDENENRHENDNEKEEEEEDEVAGPRTPKRMRMAPEVLPWGLERGDFRALHAQPLSFPQHHQSHSHSHSHSQSSSLTSSFSFSFPQPLFQSQGQPASSEPEPNAVLQSTEEGETDEQDEWTNEEDRLLVELVLEKLKLTKSDWQDCARSLGRDRGSVGRRWKSLMAIGDVGLKKRGKERARICGSWR